MSRVAAGVVLIAGILIVISLLSPQTGLIGQAAEPLQENRPCVCSCYRVETTTIFCNDTTLGEESPLGNGWVYGNDGYGNTRWRKPITFSYAESTRGVCPQACGQTCPFSYEINAQRQAQIAQAQQECLNLAFGWFDEDNENPQVHCETECSDQGVRRLDQAVQVE